MRLSWCRRERFGPIAAWRMIALTLLAAALLLQSARPVAALSVGCLPSLDYGASDTHFYAQTGSQTGLGYHVRDDADARFLTAFREGGGVPVLGYPISRRYHQDGFIYQAFQKVILQWPIGADRANYANTVDWLGRIGLDAELHAQRQVPYYFPLEADRGLDPTDPEDFGHIVQNHLQLLAVDDAIRAFFLAEPRWLELYGLPVSYEDFGPVRVLRSQRQIFQVWRVPDVGGPVGQAILANTGDIAKEFGLLPEESVVPESPPVRAGDWISASALPAGAGSPTLIRIQGTASQVRSVGHPAVSFCFGDSQHLLVPLPLDAEGGALELTLEAIGGGPALTGSVELEVEPLEFEEYTLSGIEGDLGTLFDPEVEAADRSILEEATAPITLARLSSGPFQVPLEGEITSGFGDRRHVEQRDDPLVHRGLDYAGDLGDPIAAAAAGRITHVLELTVYGRTVVIDHGLGVFSTYSHLEEFAVEPGQEVAVGDVIGTVGSTGRSTGPHLHWEVRVFGTQVNASAFLGPGVGDFGDPEFDPDVAEPSMPAEPPAVG